MIGRIKKAPRRFTDRILLHEGRAIPFSSITSIQQRPREIVVTFDLGRGPETITLERARLRAEVLDHLRLPRAEL